MSHGKWTDVQDGLKEDKHEEIKIISRLDELLKTADSLVDS